jgi:hypothetical protein
MKSRVSFPLLLVILLGALNFARAVDVKTDYDHQADFTRYKTYSWAKAEAPDSLWDERVKAAIDRELTSKGLTQVPGGGDLSVVAVGTTHQKPTLETFYDGFDGWRWGGFGMATTTVENYTEGTLIVDIFDSATKKLLWRGSASDVLSGKADKDVTKMDKAVQKMFEHFPPRPRES